MPAVRAQIDAKRFPAPREIPEPQSMVEMAGGGIVRAATGLVGEKCSDFAMPRSVAQLYTDQELDHFALSLAAALSRPGAFDRILDRINKLLEDSRSGL
jgi:hypothetical protein